MTNDVRTHLMLLAQGDPNDEGEEFIPADFVPLTPSPSVIRCRQTLFGSRADRRTINYVVNQMMAILHASSLNGFLTKDDSRITYLPSPSGSAFRSGTRVTASPAMPELGIVGPIHAETDGQSVLAYRIEQDVADVVRLIRIKPGPQTTVMPSVTEDPSRTSVAIPGTFLQLSWTTQEGVAKEWSLEVYLLFRSLLDRFYATEVHCQDAIRQVLGTKETDEPWPSLRALWNSKEAPPDRMAALFLALALRTKLDILKAKGADE